MIFHTSDFGVLVGGEDNLAQSTTMNGAVNQAWGLECADRHYDVLGNVGAGSLWSCLEGKLPSSPARGLL